VSKSVHDLIQQALRRPRRELANPGPLIDDKDGAMARFAVECDGEVVTLLEYRCTTCATLVAFCELLRERALRATTGAIASWEPADLVAWLPGIPRSHWTRAETALKALQAALPRPRNQCAVPVGPDAVC
jgi:hypothetical protein